MIRLATHGTQRLLGVTARNRPAAGIHRVGRGTTSAQPVRATRARRRVSTPTQSKPDPLERKGPDPITAQPCGQAHALEGRSGSRVPSPKEVDRCAAHARSKAPGSRADSSTGRATARSIVSPVMTTGQGTLSPTRRRRRRRNRCPAEAPSAATFGHVPARSAPQTTPLARTRAVATTWGKTRRRDELERQGDRRAKGYAPSARSSGWPITRLGRSQARARGGNAVTRSPAGIQSRADERRQPGSRSRATIRRSSRFGFRGRRPIFLQARQPPSRRPASLAGRAFRTRVGRRAAVATTSTRRRGSGERPAPRSPRAPFATPGGAASTGAYALV